MNNNADHDEEFRPDDLDALLRIVDAHANTTLAEELDVEERLARLKSAAANPQSPSDRQLAEVLARWSTELLSDANRGHGTIIRPVDDPAFFSAAVGRERTGLEPWPEMEVILNNTVPQTISVTLNLPGLASQTTRVTAVITVASWSRRLELLPIVLGNSDADDLVETSGSISLPDGVSLGSLSGVSIELNVVGQ